MKRLPLLFLSILLLAACASAQVRDEGLAGEAFMGEMPAEEAIVVEREVAVLPMATVSPAMSMSDGEPNMTEENATLLFDRKIVKHGILTIEVKDIFAALDQMTLLPTQFGGYLLESRTWYEGEYPYASLTLAIPVDEFEQAVARVRALGTVRDEQIRSQDVTEQYVDLEARIQNLEVTAARIRSFLDEARTVEEALRVNAELSRVEQELERLKGQRNALEQRTAYSTLQVQLEPVIETTTPTDEPSWSPLKTFREALMVLVEIGQDAVDLLIWAFVIGLPTLFVGGIVATLVRWLWRRLKEMLAGGRWPATAEPPLE